MADTKITALTALTAADPANDVIPIVDVSDTSMAASGTTKKISVNNILGASGTATLASATITGDLTVDTSTLKVDSTNNRVGVGTASPAYPLSVAGRISYASAIGEGPDTTVSSSGTSLLFGNSATWSENQFYANGNLQYRIQSAGIFTWTDGAGGTRMTLNSTGLGVGDSPSYKLHVAKTTDGTLGFFRRISGTINPALTVYCNETGNTVGFGTDYAGATSPSITFTTGGSERLRIDGSGNVGIGVTPKSWPSGYRALQVGVYSALTDASGGATYLTNNAYFDSVDSRWEYITNNRVVRYDQDTADGGHRWYSAAAGAVNAAITWGNPLMTLDALGNLLVGKTISSFSTVGIESSQTGFLSLTNSASTNAATNISVYSTGAAAFRFYVGLAGTVFATNTTISAISDARLKENVQDIDVGLDAILSLKPRKFDWKAGKGKDIKGDRGFIAQEFETVFPNLIDEWKDEAPEGEAPYKSVRQDLIPVLVKAIQELTARVQTLEAR